MDSGRKNTAALWVLKFLTLNLLFLSPWGVISQEEAVAQEEQEEVTQEFPEDSLGRRSPRGTVSGFIDAVAAQNFSRASRYLNLGPLLQESGEGEALVQDLQRLLDSRGNIFPYTRISAEYTGRTDDELAPGVDRVGSIHAEGETIHLLLEETQGPDGPIWLFSEETINAVEGIDVEGELFIERVSPGFLEDTLWGGVPASHWLSLILLAVVVYFVSWGIVSGLLFLILRFWKKARTEPTRGVIKSLSLPFRLYVAVWAFVSLTEGFGVSIVLRQHFSGITVIIGIIAFLILLWELSDIVSRFSERRMSLRGNLSGVSIILFLRRTAKIAIIIFGIIAILGAVGVDVTAGLAALGLGGIALALGAQKTVENFVGSVTLILDQPVRVGDFCTVGDTTGTVEKIGVRSTRIRTLERTTVTIPNREFSSATIENYATRDRFLFSTMLGFRYETTPDQIRFLLSEIRAIFYSHPFVSPDPAKIRFVELGASSLDLEIFAYITAPNFDEFVEVKEDLLLRIMDKVAESGTDFAFPSQTIYFARDAGLSPEKAREAEERVREWREKKEMPIPGFDPETIREMKNSISYPPDGSVKRKNNPLDE